jgi:RHS repeat-associated protein
MIKRLAWICVLVVVFCHLGGGVAESISEEDYFQPIGNPHYSRVRRAITTWSDESYTPGYPKVGNVSRIVWSTHREEIPAELTSVRVPGRDLPTNPAQIQAAIDSFGGAFGPLVGVECGGTYDYSGTWISCFPTYAGSEGLPLGLGYAETTIVDIIERHEVIYRRSTITFYIPKSPPGQAVKSAKLVGFVYVQPNAGNIAEVRVSGKPGIVGMRSCPPYQCGLVAWDFTTEVAGISAAGGGLLDLTLDAIPAVSTSRGSEAQYDIRVDQQYGFAITFFTAPPSENRPKEVAQGPRSAPRSQLLRCPREYVGRPINLTTGNMYTQQEDLAYPSGFGRFGFTRTYNSQSTSQGPLGLGWTHPFEYELKELRPGVIRVRNGAGNVRFYEPVAAGSSTYRVAAPARDTSTLVKHAAGFTEMEREGLRREFDSQGHLLTIVTRAGWTTTLAYADGRLARVTDPGGRTLVLSYNGEGRLTRVEGPGGLFAQYDYDGQGRLVSVSDGLGARWTYTYSDTTPARLTSVRDANGHVVEQHTYDAAGRVVAFTQADGVKALALEYVDSSHTRITDSLGRQTTYTFGVFGDLPLVTQVDGPCPCGQPDTTITYDARGRSLQEMDALGHTMQYEYDADGNLAQITDALGQVTTFTYNGFGQVLTTTGPTGAITAFTYDGTTGLLVQVTDALGQITTLSPDAHNLPRAITNPRGQTTAFAYADTGLLSSVTDPTGAQTTVTYDAAGRLVQVTNALNGQTAYTYDARGRLLTVTDPLGAVTRFAYDPAGNRTGFTDPNGRQTTYTYDAANRLTRVTDPAGGTTAYAYDTQSNLLSLTDAKGQTTAFAYDNHNRVITRTDSVGKSEAFSYDAVGNLSTRTDRKGQTITFAYDALNRLIEKNLHDGASVTYNYDPVGRLSRATDGGGALAFTYDALGRVLTTTTPEGRTLTYTYDAAGNRIGLQDETGSVTSYAYDPRNVLTGITDPRSGTFALGHDPLGRRITLTRPNGIDTAYAYDAASRLTGLRHAGHRHPLETLAYAYDPTGNRTADTRSGLSHQYTYDSLDQLTQVQRQEHRSRWHLEEVYTYDPVGNRLTADHHQTYSYDAANRLTTDGKSIYTYDANGNLVEKRRLHDGAVTTYTYDAEDRLVRVVTPKAEVIFQYDPLGRRIEKRVVRWHDEDGDHEPDEEEEGHPRVIRYLYDQEDILATFDDRGHTLARYTHGPGIDEPLAEVRHHRTRFYHADVLGSIIALTDRHGHPSRHYRYSAFGVPEEHKADSQLYRFTGREWDRETGLYYYRARYYDAEDGRFLQEDPVGLVGGNSNLYQYAKNNPLYWVDPLGLYESPWILRTLVPGQVAWDNAMTAWERGDYLKSAIYGTTMLGEQVLVALTFGSQIGQVGQVCRSGAAESGGAIQTTLHGAERIAGSGATRGGVLDAAEILATRAGKTLTQSDGATVRIQEVEAGKFNVVVEGAQGVITTFRHLNQEALGRLAGRYGWR